MKLSTQSEYAIHEVWDGYVVQECKTNGKYSYTRFKTKNGAKLYKKKMETPVKSRKCSMRKFGSCIAFC